MAYNLFVAYDLIPPGQHYERVIDRIMALGAWHKFQYSLWYLHTQYSPREAYALIWEVMDARDKLAVIDANAGVVSSTDKPLIDAINAIWLQR